MVLRSLEERDLDVVRQLRNDNRHWFFDDREISAEQQRRWFAGLADAPLRFYVLEVEGAVVGTISATETPEGTEIGNLLLDERYRGRGLMAQAIEELTSGQGRFFSRIKPDNRSSLAVFERAGFTQSYVVLERG